MQLSEVLMEQPLISLITVCYNAEKLIEETLQSATRQTYKHVEMVIVDGGSTDRTVEIAHRFDAWIGTLISEPDGGIYDAMNKGIKAAKGEWVYFLNAGDAFYDENVLADIFSGKSYDGINLLYGKVQTRNEPTGIDYIAGERVSLKDFYARYPICHQATFTRRSCFGAVGYFNLRYKLAGDTEWFARLFTKAPGTALFIDRIIAFYDIQGATYHRRMQGYREYLHFGATLFPWYIAARNWLFYPLLWMKVKFIRSFQNTSLFKKYREAKFRKNLANFQKS
jgi:glycosyltransferase involved in cell wall biosynthesis